MQKTQKSSEFGLISIAEKYAAETWLFSCFRQLVRELVWALSQGSWHWLRLSALSFWVVGSLSESSLSGACTMQSKLELLTQVVEKRGRFLVTPCFIACLM